MALRRQPSTFSDSIDANYIGEMYSFHKNFEVYKYGFCYEELNFNHDCNITLHLIIILIMLIMIYIIFIKEFLPTKFLFILGVVINNCGIDEQPGRDGGLNPGGYPSHADDRSHSGETYRSSNLDEEMSICRQQSLSGGTTSQGSCQPDIQCSTSYAPITDITPNKAKMRVGIFFLKYNFFHYLYEKGGTKVLIIGGWYMKGHDYSVVFEDITGSINLFSSLDEDLILLVLRTLQPRPLLHPEFFSAHPSLPSRTILHLAAALDHFKVIEYILGWRQSLPFTREFDPLARDGEGRTPLHVAVGAGHVSSARFVFAYINTVLVRACRTTVDVLDDRGRTPCDLSSDEQLTRLTARNMDREADEQRQLPKNAEDVEHVTSTALWVLTNGETVTDEHLLRERRQQRELFNLFLFLDYIPGGLLDDGVRAKMALLAQQIIDALPDRIKVCCPQIRQRRMMSFHHFLGNHRDHHSIIIISILKSKKTHIYIYIYILIVSDRFIYFLVNPETAIIFVHLLIDLVLHISDFHVSDGEQREVYGAAMVIQRAYREYRARNTTRRQADAERRAAITIQSCYRRYKQFCYFKKLHNAAIVVQKHFRLKKVNQREHSISTSTEVPEHPTLDGQSIRIQIPQNSSSLLREHRAATTIQLAYRGHRKRQAAARKIQKFMKESRLKLRRIQEQNEGVSSALENPQKDNTPVQLEPLTHLSGHTIHYKNMLTINGNSNILLFLLMQVNDGIYLFILLPIASLLILQRRIGSIQEPKGVLRFFIVLLAKLVRGITVQHLPSKIAVCDSSRSSSAPKCQTLQKRPKISHSPPKGESAKANASAQETPEKSKGKLTNKLTFLGVFRAYRPSALKLTSGTADFDLSQ
uniref:ANK_REP_REGION domain-containing protein n=1 Tax=Heterorhabditis bacteriophora TaxID=37862 RepID=A0A1I7WGY8_HETBA